MKIKIIVYQIISKSKYEMDSKFVSVIQFMNYGGGRKMVGLPFTPENKQETNEVESRLQGISSMTGCGQKSAVEKISKDMELKRKMRERLNKKKANK